MIQNSFWHICPISHKFVGKCHLGPIQRLFSEIVPILPKRAFFCLFQMKMLQNACKYLNRSYSDIFSAKLLAAIYSFEEKSHCWTILTIF